ERLKLAPGTNLDFATTVPQGQEVLFAEYRYKHSLALERVKAKVEAVEEEFYRHFGRRYGGLVETYRAEDAEVVLVTAGSCAGTAKVVVDRAREAGQRVGLVRIRVFRPFPRERLRELLNGKRGVGVIDRSVCLGWHCGHLFMELKAIWHEIEARPAALVDFIDGVGNLDITVEHVQQALDLTRQAIEGEKVPEVNWLMLAD
ncbi:MAG: pyruvate synthase subunit PorA, partial [Clostridia bacterium]|nr:pyruvate synthase subunit PorA [Clostridia bacterium]